MISLSLPLRVAVIIMLTMMESCCWVTGQQFGQQTASVTSSMAAGGIGIGRGIGGIMTAATAAATTNDVHYAAAAAVGDLMSSQQQQSHPYYAGGYYPGSDASQPVTGYRAPFANLVSAPVGFNDPNGVGVDGSSVVSSAQLASISSLPVTVPYDSEQDFFGQPAPQRLIEDPNVFAPDLSIDTRPEVVDWSIDTVWINHTACAVQEGCVLPGLRRLLRFNTRINNLGTADFVVGNPYHDVNETFFHYHACHRHFHWPHVLDCQLVDQNGNQAARGMKIGFCLEDFFPAKWPMLPLGKARFDCVHQGISEGWADQYHKNLDCQWIDVTDVPNGKYNLVITVNEGRTFHELSFDNNRGIIPIEVTTSDKQQGVAVNDFCAGAIDVVINQHLLVNTKGSTSDGMKCNSISEPKSSVWFKVRGTGHRMLASTCNPDTTVDTVLMVFRDCTGGQQLCAGGSAVCVTANDDDLCGASAYSHWCSEPNVDYFIVVGGIDEAYGTIDLTVMIIDDDFESLFFAKPPVNPNEPCSGPMIGCGTDTHASSPTPTPPASGATTTAGLPNMGGMYPAVNGMCPAPAVVNLNFGDMYPSGYGRNARTPSDIATASAYQQQQQWQQQLQQQLPSSTTPTGAGIP